ncbi:MAG: helix-turn-helix transcriptional regulator [Alphaproteobacteria bacterium]|nr:helix-turn-helix transcriptional regulator [Alphaproteobacteria bacterium]
MITARQIRAARALLGWDASVLAQKAGITKEAISRIEGEKVRPHERTLVKLFQAFDEAGIAFTPQSGVQLKQQNVDVLEGTPGFARFYDYIYEYLSNHGGEVCISGVKEALFLKYHGEYAQAHIKRMAKLVNQRQDFRMRILVEEGDTDFTSSNYAQYKWQPKEHFSPAAFYVFGENIALISFDHDPAPLVVLIRSSSLAISYKRAFDLAWKMAIDPPNTGHKD